MRAILVSAILAVLPLSAVAAQPETIQISVSQADLKTDAGLSALLIKIEGAAKEVCKQEPSTFDAIDRGLACERAAVADAIEDAKIAALTNYVTSLRVTRSHPMSATLASR